MKKYRGFMFMELIVISGIFSVIILPLIMLMNKNIKNIRVIKYEYEMIKTTENLENIFNSLVKENEIEGRYFFEKKENVFILKDSEKKITVLRGIKYLENLEINIFKKNIFSEDDGEKKNISKVYVLEIKDKNKNIRKILYERF